MIVLAPIKLALIYFLAQYMCRDWIELDWVWVGFDWIEFDFVCTKQRAVSVWPLTEGESNDITQLCANQI